MLPALIRCAAQGAEFLAALRRSGIIDPFVMTSVAILGGGISVIAGPSGDTRMGEPDPSWTRPALVDGEPRGSDDNPLRAHIEWDSSEGCPIGRDPRQMTVEELEKLGHHKRPAADHHPRNCIECCGGNQAEGTRKSAIARIGTRSRNANGATGIARA
jgi:hypothetical protein